MYLNFLKKENFLSNILLILFFIWLIDQISSASEIYILSKVYGFFLITLLLILTISVILTFFNIFFNKKKFITYFFIIFFSSFLVSFFFDLYKDIIEKKNIENFYEKKTLKRKENYKFDTRQRKEVIKELRKSHDKVFNTMSPFFLIRNELKNINFLPLNGISNAKTVLCNESGKFAIYTSDKFGFNNPNYIYQSLSNEKIILIGDSWIHGACVQEHETISANMRENKLDIINLAYSGNGPLLELATLIEYINLFKPKKIIWFYYENDLRELVLEKKSEILINYLDKEDFSQDLYKKQNSIDKFWEKLIEKYNYIDVLGGNIKISKRNFSRQIIRKLERSLRLKSFYDILKKFLNVQLSTFYKIEEIKEINLFEKIMKKAKKVSKQNNAELYFVYLSSLNTVQTSSPASYNEILKIVNKLDIPTLDFYNFLSSINNPEKLFPFEMPFSHFNKLGIKKLSDEVIKEFNLKLENY